MLVNFYYQNFTLKAFRWFMRRFKQKSFRYMIKNLCFIHKLKCMECVDSAWKHPCGEEGNKEKKSTAKWSGKINVYENVSEKKTANA
jgi:hypothetical protein